MEPRVFRRVNRTAMTNHFSKNLRQQDNRRGVTLLFVISMLVLFLLLATSFVIVSNNYFRSARKRSRNHLYTSSTDAKNLIERAFYEVVRGTSLADTSSPLRGHSLLGDMYGYGFTVTAEAANVDQSEHFIEFTLADDAVKVIDGTSYTPIPVPGMFGGLVVTVTTGPAAGLSGRVIDHQVKGDKDAGYTHGVLVMPITANNRVNARTAKAISGSRLVFNGRAFAGTGAGHFNSYTPAGSPALDGLAKKPNQSRTSLKELIGDSGAPGYFSRLSSTGTFTPNSMAPNESYDAFDFQNVFLGGLTADGLPVSVSYYRHRDEELQSGGLSVGGNKKHDRGDFRAFRASSIKNTTKLVDDNNIQVDNNNDTIADGIWMDIGLPIQCRDDGQCVKPLVSYLIVDMDSRINVNAHGSLYRDLETNLTPRGLLDAPNGLPKGQGYGPPEISMAQSVAGYEQIMRERYGDDGLPGEPNVRDEWSLYKLFGYPESKFDDLVPGSVSRHFGSSMDIHGRLSIGYPADLIDLSTDGGTIPVGMPVADISGSMLENEVVDSPYEMSFFDGSVVGPVNSRSHDNPFSGGELELVLRPRDIDSHLLDKRLSNLVIGNEKNQITTHSFEVPTLYVNLASRLYRLLDDGMPKATADREQAIRDQVRALLPPEVFRGLPMNVNREFGDGTDNNGNGVIDEMGEEDVLEHPGGESIPFDHDNDSIAWDLDSVFARSKFATHLYIVTLLTTERVDRNGDGNVDVNDWYDFNDDGATDNQDLLDYRKVIAQWAVNVVDYRDVDSIMTAFEFDLEPWNGWDEDGDPSTELSKERSVVWGAERPELLITETMATHDRRTQNLEIESVSEDDSAAIVADGDEDFDSHLVPRVSAFFELYNPWVVYDSDRLRPAELYDSGLNGVELQKTSPDGSSPVWRLLVSETDQQDLDPDDPTENENEEAVSSVRRIYFQRPLPKVDQGPQVYYPDEDLKIDSVYPGGYAVVGTAGKKVGERYDTYFGRKDNDNGATPEVLEKETRRISLYPSTNELEITYFDTDQKKLITQDNFQESGADDPTRDAIVLPIGKTDTGWDRELGVSDPIDGYYGLPGEGISQVDLEPIEDGQKFTEDETTGAPIDYAFDQPVDQVADEEHFKDYLENDGLRPGYRMVHLQRLANPLLPFEKDTNPYRTVDSAAIDLFVFNGVEKEEDPSNSEPGNMRFGTCERRGDQVSGPNGQLDDHYRQLFRNDRLGYVNADEDLSPELKGADDDSHVLNMNLIESLGFMNDAYEKANQDNQPFAWLSWNNRPYVSQFELVNVPYTSSYWMTRQFGIADASLKIYSPPVATNPETGARNYSGPFPHLLNFFADETGASGNGPSLSRMLDFVEVPSRFIGTETFVNPETFVNSDFGMSYGMVAPFDKVSTFRYPGKLNINTVLNHSVWNDMMGSYITTNLLQWKKSREESPFRAAHAANFVPEKAKHPADAGLFRAGSTASSPPLFDFESTQRANDTNRSAYFRYAMRQRMGNLVTSRSSVFAIWVTIGFFEVDGEGVLKIDPQDLTKGIEAGSVTGNVHRHRGFYLFDRSIPVGFEPGKNHNVDRAVMIKTLIE